MSGDGAGRNKENEMKQFKAILWTAAAICAAAGAAWAGDWHRVGDFSTSREAQEIGANYQNVRRVEIQCLEGNPIVQTVWVRNGGQKQEVRVAHAFTKGEKYTIELGGRDITGFRISTGNKGLFRIHVLTDGHRREEPRHDYRDDRDNRYDRRDRDDWYDRRDRDDRYDRRDRRDRDDWYDRYDRDDRRGPPPPPRSRDDRDDRGGWFPWW